MFSGLKELKNLLESVLIVANIVTMKLIVVRISVEKTMQIIA